MVSLIYTNKVSTALHFCFIDHTPVNYL